LNSNFESQILHGTTLLPLATKNPPYGGVTVNS